MLAGLALLLPGCEGSGPASEAVLHALDAPGAASGPAFTQSADPSLAVDPESGDLVVAWVATTAADPSGAWDLYVARSSNGGRSFTEPVRVNDVPGDVYPHAEGAPRLVAGPGTLAVFWNNRIEVEGRRFAASDLRFSRSVDGGRSWTPAASIQDQVEPSTLPARAHTFHGATWVGTSTLVVAWLDGRERDARRLDRAVEDGHPLHEAARTPEAFALEHDPRDGDATVFAAVSHDGGASWEDSNRRISGATCPCCRVSLVAGPEGDLLGSWRRHFDGSIRDPVVARVDLGTGSEDAPFDRVHEDGWVFHGCPHSGPALDVGPDGTTHVAWYTGAEGRLGVYHARRTASEPGFTIPVPVTTGEAIGIAHPAVLALPDGGALVATNVDAQGERVIVLSRISSEGEVSVAHRVPDSDGGTHPQLALVAGWGVIAAWTRSRDGEQQMQIVRLELPEVNASEGGSP
jgi:hypothetical protein